MFFDLKWRRAACLAALLAVVAEAAVAESFGRLFFHPLERQQLDQARDDGQEQAPEPGPTTKRQPEAPVVDVISFDGKVERSGGGSTVWVNGRPVFTGDRTAEGIRVRSSRGTNGEARFELPPSESGTGTTDFSLKVGQKVAVQNGRKFEAYEARPGEDAESVLGGDAPADAAAQPEGSQPADEADDDAAPAPPRKN
jgi:hypothetical protein